MKEIIKINTVKQFNDGVGIETKHPLVSVVNFYELSELVHFKLYMNLYAVILKDIKCGDMTYGCQSYDYEDGTLVFVSPGQIFGIDSNGIAVKPSGYALIFHPDFIRETHLGKMVNEYTFFNYQVNEALHLSKKERNIIIDCLDKISSEIEQNIDKHSKTLISSNIELFLNYCMRFYDRQFITRSSENKDILVRFEEILNDYLKTNKAQHLGLPSVSYCANKLHISPNYFGDLIKKETGQTALDYIQNKIINEAKTKIFDTSKSINDVSSELGFKYQQHFTRFFKQKTGYTPNEYRNLN